MKTLVFHATEEAATLALAAKLARVIQYPCFITLSGQLGAGKTTFTRGILRALGYAGNVKSPTFTVVESYVLPEHIVHHFDLYRINGRTELELMGFRDYFHENALILLEWPEHAAEMLPAADIDCNITVEEGGRVLTLTAYTDGGQKIVHQLKNYEAE